MPSHHNGKQPLRGVPLHQPAPDHCTMDREMQLRAKTTTLTTADFRQLGWDYFNADLGGNLSILDIWIQKKI